MVSPVPLDLAEDWVPQAIINRPISYFSDRFNMPVRKYHDDLDEFEGAALKVSDDVIVALKHYAGYPDNTTTIYLSGNIADVPLISNVLLFITTILDIPPTLIAWQRQDNPEC
jgi:hypothetical protein